MTQLPPPPEEYSESEQAAYQAGAAAMARLIGSYAMTVAGALEDDDQADGDDETCPECGVEYVEGFGGLICPRCGSPPPTATSRSTDRD